MFDDSNKRFLQSTLDSVSAGLNLPVRLLSLDELRNLEQKAIQLTSLPENLETAYSQMISVMSAGEKEHRQSEKSILSIDLLAVNHDAGKSEDQYRTAAAKIAEIEHKLFKTTASNSHNFIDLFRLSPEWRWFELLWFFSNKNLFENSNNTPFEIPAFGLPTWRFICKRLTCDKGYLLVAGPLNFIERGDDKEHYFKSIGLVLRNIYLIFNENYCRKSVTKRFSTEELDRALRLRLPITSETIDSRMTLAEKVVSYVLDNCSILLTERHETASVEPKSIRSTAELALAVGRLAQSLYFHERLSFHYNKKDVPKKLRQFPDFSINEEPRIIAFRFTIPIGNHELLSIDMEISVNRGATPDTLEWNFKRMSDMGPASENRIITLVNVNGVNLSDTAFLQSVVQKLERWTETAHARHKSYLANRTNLIGSWLSHNFLKTKNDAENDNGNINGKRSATKLEVYNVISDFIAESTRTEMCQIYRYYSHRDGGTMKVLGGAVRGGVWCTNDSDMVVDHMTKFAVDKSIPITNKIKRSIVYRAAASRKMCYEEVSETGIFRNVCWPTNVIRPRGIVAAPILIEGRVWGVIEIATPSAGEIDTATQYSISDYSGVLGVYFFSITYNQNIRSLSLWSGSEFTQMPNQVAEVSKRFAERICRITLGQSALVLLQKPNEGGCVYDIAGYAGNGKSLPEKKQLEIDLESTNGKRFLAGKMWRAYVDEDKTFISAKVDRDADEDDSLDNRDYITLGKKYFDTIVDEGDVGDFISESTSQIMAFTFDVVKDLESPIEEKVFGIEIGVIRRADQGPTGMVLVYFDNFIDRPHWHGVNTDIAIRLANCYKDILVDRQRQSDKGALVRHEVKQTVFAIAAAAAEARRTSEYLRHSLSAALKKDHIPHTLVEQLRDMSDATIRLGKLTDNMHNSYDLLLTQIQSIERADYADLGALSSTVPTEVLRSAYTCLPQILDSFALQYKKRFYDRKIHYRFGEMPENLHIRIRTEYVSFLIRNVFDNWAKYASSGTIVSVDLVPEYNVIRRPDSYILIFTSFIDTPVTKEDAESWFKYGKRGGIGTTASVDGDGIGLFWIRQILQNRFGIRVYFDVKDTDTHRPQIRLCWRMNTQWLTTSPELEISE